MSKLIGKSPNQVPSNADLGSAAFVDVKDVLLAKGSNLSAVNSVIPGVANKVFVYDTTTDSDGGAWRKRTQNTSWYNEKLNTATRGSRREFPSVAVIILENYKLRIHDGDDPDLPMWMIFERGPDADPTKWWDGNNANVGVTLSMMNGFLFMGTTSAGSYSVNFINEELRNWYSLYSGIRQATVEQRNDLFERFGYDGTDNTASSCVDMILTIEHDTKPNPNTGLPDPTIIWTHNGGTILISPSKKWFNSDRSGYTFMRYVSNSYPGAMRLSAPKHNYNNSFVATYNLATSGQGAEVINLNWLRTLNDEAINGPVHATNSYVSNRRQYTYGNSYDVSSNTFNQPRVVPNFGVASDVIHTNENEIYFAGDGAFGSQAYNTGYHLGLLRIKENVLDPDKSMLNLTNSRYNTGWMYGDTKVATLMDTQTGPVLGGNLVDADLYAFNKSSQTSGATTGTWSLDNGFTISGGKLNWSAGTGREARYEISGLIPGQKYIAMVDIESVSGTNFGMYTTQSRTEESQGVREYYGSILTIFCVFTPVAGDNGAGIRIRNSAATGSGTLDNFRVYRAVDDRTVYSGYRAWASLGDGVQRVKVAKGSDLVCYTGWGASSNGYNYLYQPYANEWATDPDYMTFSCWFNIDITSDFKTIYVKGDSDAHESMRIGVSSTYGVYFDYGTGASYAVTQISGVLDYSEFENQWTHLVCIARRNRPPSIYINGQNVTANIYGNGLSAIYNRYDHYSLIGIGYSNANPLAATDKLALLRVSFDEPSEKEIMTMYQEELPLFRQNAKAVFGGSHDEGNAVAYDEVRKELHVGTDSGRSVFRGLQRIDYVDEPVTSSISVSNGFVAEE